MDNYSLLIVYIIPAGNITSQSQSSLNVTDFWLMGGLLHQDGLMLQLEGKSGKAALLSLHCMMVKPHMITILAGFHGILGITFLIHKV